MSESVADDQKHVTSIRSQLVNLSSKAMVRDFVSSLLITACHFVLALSQLSGTEPMWKRWLRLFNWDSGWYHKIAFVTGYEVTFPITKQHSIAFFPAYPLLCRYLNVILRVETLHAMLITSTLVSIFVWFFAQRIMRMLNFSLAERALCIVAMVCFPSAFYLHIGYSEGLMIATMLGFIYFSMTTLRPTSCVGAAASGFVMTATRIVAVPVAFGFVIQRIAERICQVGANVFDMTRKGSLWEHPPPHRIRSLFTKEDLLSVAVAVFALCGCLSFFLFSYLKFGVWNANQQARALGWFGVAQPEALYAKTTWWIRRREVLDLVKNIHIPSLNRASTVFFSLTLVGCLAVEVLISGLRTFVPSKRFVLLLTAATLHFAAIVGGYDNGSYMGMIRYDLPVHVCMCIYLMSLMRESLRAFIPRIMRGLMIVALFIGAVWMLHAQMVLIKRFSEGVLVS